MPFPAADPAVSQERRAIIELLLAEGFAPPNQGGGRGSAIEEAARRLGHKSSCTLNSWLATQRRRAAKGQSHYLPDWSKHQPAWQAAAGTAPAPHPKAPARRWVLTGAQDETPVHEGFWENLLAFAGWARAEIVVGGFTYNKSLFEDHASRTAVFAEAVQPYLAHAPVDLGPVVFCAEINILPTAVRPLSGLDAYTRGKWGVFPHAKVQLASVPTISGRPTILMTTGACTVANYIQKKAGQKAEFHHVIGATLVEIDGEGRPFCRQLNASDDGSFQDLDVRVSKGVVTTGNRVEAITWGDLHREKIDPVVAMAAWSFDVEADRCVGGETMMDALRPRYQFFHDILDFDARNHHRRADHHHRFQMICQGTDLVQEAVGAVARFLRATERDWCRSVVVESNHDSALLRWLKESDYREDPANAEFFLDCQREIYASIRRGEPGFNIFRWALERADPRGLTGIDFVPEDGSFVICQAHGGVECGMHGHLGLNGARGSPAAFTKMAMKMNTGHTHSASILDGVYTAGLSGLLDQGYNKGPSSWSNSHIVTYSSGKRSIVTMLGGKWRA
jgi:hypothetical protein